MAARRLTDLDLPPDVFAVVMATGIVSVAARDHAYSRLGTSLAAVAGAVFVVLVVGLVIRVIARPRSAFGEVRDPDVAFRLFTFVAACTVLGVRFDDHLAVVWLLGAAALAAWLLLTPLALRDARSRPRAQLRDHAHGAWLLPSVATAGLAITAADLATSGRWPPLVVGAALAWVLAITAYGAVTWLVAWRSVAAGFAPEQVTPDSWILMGALAITTLAGDHLLAAARSAGAAQWLIDSARPLTIATWVLSSLWIPFLLYAELWRVDQRAGSVHYAGVWWSAVFPLGMYSSATAATAGEFQLPSLRTISLVFFWVAFTVWVLVAVGAIHFAVARRRAAMR